MANKRNVPQEPLTSDELQRLSLPPKMSLEDLSKGKGNSTDWYNLMFRITATEIICSIGYSEECHAALTAGRKLCEVIFDREAKKGLASNWLVIPDTEYHELSACLEVAEEVQKQMDRSTQVYAYKKAYAKCMKYIRLFDKMNKIKTVEQPLSWNRQPA